MNNRKNNCRVKSYDPKTQAELLATHLGELINNGALAGLLPSVRDLAQTHNVSTVTVSKALKLLSSQGLLVNRGPKRRALVAPLIQGEKPKLLVVLQSPVRSLHVSIVASLRLLHEKCLRDGVIYEEVSVNRLLREVAFDVISKSLSNNVLRRIIGIHLEPELGDMLVKSGVNVAVLPATPISLPGATVFRVPHVGVLCHIVQKAGQLGHRDFVMVDNVTTAPFRAQLSARVHAMGGTITFLKAGSLGADNWIHDKKAIDRICRQIQRSKSSCILFAQWADFMACADYLKRNRLAFPGRFSVAIAYRNGSVVSYHGLQVAGCDIPEDLAFRMWAAWLDDGHCDCESFSDEVIATFRVGDSLQER